MSEIPTNNLIAFGMIMAFLLSSFYLFFKYGGRIVIKEEKGENEETDNSL